MDVIHELTESHIQDLHNLYKNEWWTNQRTLQQTRQCVQGSQICIGLLDNNEMVGFVRVITDYTFKALILDLIINKKYRAQDLGAKLMQLVKHHENLNQVTHFELYCLPELVDYYKQFDFSEEIGGIKLLRCDKA